MSVKLSTIRDYLGTLTWVEGGLLTQDMHTILDFLESTPDSRYFVSETKRCIALVAHWSERVRYAVRRLEIDISQSRDNLDQSVKRQLTADRRQIKMRYIDAAIMKDPDHRRLVDSLHQYEMVLGTLEGLSLALETSLVVQESVSARMQELSDLNTP